MRNLTHTELHCQLCLSCILFASLQSTTTLLRSLRQADKVSETRSTSLPVVSVLCAALRATETRGQLRKSSVQCRRLKQIIFPLPLCSIPTSYTARGFFIIEQPNIHDGFNSKFAGCCVHGKFENKLSLPFLEAVPSCSQPLQQSTLIRAAASGCLQ